MVSGDSFYSSENTPWMLSILWDSLSHLGVRLVALNLRRDRITAGPRARERLRTRASATWSARRICVERIASTIACGAQGKLSAPALNVSCIMLLSHASDLLLLCRGGCCWFRTPCFRSISLICFFRFVSFLVAQRITSLQCNAVAVESYRLLR